ncbi:MAG: 3-isopropylmalate dehydratase [Candidatus Binatia bacterium]
MADLCFKGVAWTFGSQIDTDQIVPGQFLNATLDEQSRHVFETICPEFCSEFTAGGIIVAGSNFGCGSSRESAPEVLKHLGAAAVIAESFARIFFRNAIAIGFPVLVCPGVAGEVMQGDHVEVDMQRARVTTVERGRTLQGVPLNAIMLECLKQGGIMKLLVEP